MGLGAACVIGVLLAVLVTLGGYITAACMIMLIIKEGVNRQPRGRESAKLCLVKKTCAMPDCARREGRRASPFTRELPA
jgi:hypothetical protein